jgi:chemotaxis protein MotB
MKKQILTFTLVGLFFSGCVSKKEFTALENKYIASKKENENLTEQLNALNKAKEKLQQDQDALQAQFKKATEDQQKLAADYKATADKLKLLQDSYNALEKNSSQALQDNISKNKELLNQLEAKSKALALEQERLDKNNQQLKELQDLIASKEAAMKKLKETLSKALNGFADKGLTVTQKDGKVYVSMENKLLFNSGSWAVGNEGKKAIDALSKVLGENPDIAVLIEGHTDDVPYVPNGAIADNWDLSTKRATAIVGILSENKKINKANLTAAGRGEYAPLESNETAEGKARNRRIEVILTPKLDEITKMLDEL